MAKISVAVRNTTNDDYSTHVYDWFGGGPIEVDGSPFPLAAGETSPQFSVNANKGTGKIQYRCDGGPTLGDIEVTDGDIVDIS